MSTHRSIVNAAFLTVLAMGGLSQAPLARGADAGPFSIGDDRTAYLDVQPAAPGDTAAGQTSAAPTESLNTRRAPLMAGLDALGAAQALDSARVNIYGHIEGSYTYNTDNPAQGLNLGRVFDINDNRVQLNQLDLNFERKADPHQWDVGGRIEMLYGADSRFIHSSDFIDYGNKNVATTTNLYNGPEYQFDIPQLYVDLTLPFGNGIRVRFGKFLFFKQIDPNASVFYSHSFTFGAALPFTLTGVTAMYSFSEALSVEAGLSRGWGQTFTDNNGAIDALARVRLKLNKDADLTVALITGPELNADNSHYRTAIDGTLSWYYDDNLTFLVDGVYGVQAQPSGITDDMWYGVSGYAVYKLSNAININGRAEIYRDEEGFTTGVPQTLFEVTAGLTFTPFPGNAIGEGFKVRPEVRYDYSTRDYFNGLSDHGQLTLAVDAYFDF